MGDQKFLSCEKCHINLPVGALYSKCYFCRQPAKTRQPRKDIEQTTAVSKRYKSQSVLRSEKYYEYAMKSSIDCHAYGDPWQVHAVRFGIRCARIFRPSHPDARYQGAANSLPIALDTVSSDYNHNALLLVSLCIGLGICYLE
jgi:hypothetical protein